MNQQHITPPKYNHCVASSHRTYFYWAKNKDLLPIHQQRTLRLQAAQVAGELVRELHLQVRRLVLVVGELGRGAPLLLSLLSLLLLPLSCGQVLLVQLFLEGPAHVLD